MLLLAFFIALVLLILGYRFAVIGLFIGTGVSTFNYWLVSRDPWEKTFNPLLKRYLARMLLSGAVVVGTALVDIRLLFGAVAGLTLEMQTYLLDVFQVIFRR